MKREIVKATVSLQLKNNGEDLFEGYFLIHYWGFIPHGCINRVEGPAYHPTTEVRYF